MFTLICKKVFGKTNSGTIKKTPEDAICIAFADMIRQMQILDLCKKHFVWTHVSNEYSGGRGGKVFGHVQRCKGKISGWPDYVFMFQGGSFGIEFKAGKNKQTENQKVVQSWFDEAGVQYYVCYNVNQGLDVLVKHGLID